MDNETYIIRVISGTGVYVVCRKDDERQDTTKLLWQAKWVGKNYRRARFQKWFYNLLDKL